MEVIIGNPSSFDNSGFWKKLAGAALAMGRDLVHSVLALYYAIMDEQTDLSHRGIIAGALLYVISPLDAIPDLTPFVGYADDATVVALTLTAVAESVTEKHFRAAERKLKKWFS